MFRTAFSIICLLTSVLLAASCEKRPSYPFYEYDIARSHEMKPHRPLRLPGVRHGQDLYLWLTLIVSPTGEVVAAGPRGVDKPPAFWPQVQGEIRGWRFRPFEQNGKAVTAQVEEYIQLLPPERLPKMHVEAPVLRPGSKVKITLQRSVCNGDCPEYTVTVTTEGILFEGGRSVVAPGKHTSKVDADEVRKLARRFIDADFYSMDSRYTSGVKDNSDYVLAISIDGHTKRVEDDEGPLVGMPAVITELEDEVDALARTQRWIKGDEAH